MTGAAGPAIRPGREHDLPGIVEIINHYVRHTAITFDLEPFTVETRRPWFDQFAATGRYRLWVATEGDRLSGYAASMPFRAKAAYETSVETSVYLHPDARGRSLGAHLYSALFASLVGEDLHRALAGVTLPNPASIALHRRFGFRSTGVLHEVGRKQGRYWDVEWFEKSLAPGG